MALKNLSGHRGPVRINLFPVLLIRVNLVFLKKTTAYVF
jgi:hypothetical protein